MSADTFFRGKCPRTLSGEVSADTLSGFLDGALLLFTSPNLSALLEPPVPLDLFLLAYTSASLHCPGVPVISLTTIQFSSAQEAYKSFAGCSNKK